MQFPKIAFVICAIAVANTALSAEDNADQAAARALLVSKLFEISGESTPANTTSQPTKPATVNTAPSFSTTTKVVPAVKAENNAVMHPVNQTVAPAYTPMTPMTPMDSETHYRILRTPHDEIQNPSMNWTKASTVPSPNGAYGANSSATKGASSSTRTAPVTSQPTMKTSAEFAPVVAPALPIGAGKQQKLVDLLAKYKADQISPEEYHRQRAAILNGM